MFRLVRQLSRLSPLRAPMARIITLVLRVVPGRSLRLEYRRDAEQWIHRWGTGTLVDASPRGYEPEFFERRLHDHVIKDHRVRTGDVVIELGAGTGTETLFLSRLVGETGTVLAVEAHPRTFAMLQTTVAENQLDNVATIQAFVAETGGATTHMTDDEGHHSNRGVDDGSGVAVPTLTLDEIADRVDGRPIGFLKVNIEGAETAALRGAATMLSTTRQVSVSCHDFKAHEDPALATASDVRTVLTDAGFDLSPWEPDGTWRTSYVHGTNSNL